MLTDFLKTTAPYFLTCFWIIYGLCTPPDKGTLKNYALPLSRCFKYLHPLTSSSHEVKMKTARRQSHCRPVQMLPLPETTQSMCWNSHLNYQKLKFFLQWARQVLRGCWLEHILHKPALCQTASSSSHKFLLMGLLSLLSFPLWCLAKWFWLHLWSAIHLTNSPVCSWPGCSRATCLWQCCLEH